MNLFKALVRLVGLLAIAGCSSLAPRLETPDLRIVQVTLLGGSLASQDLRLTIEVDNPNKRQLAVRGIDYRVALGGTEFAEGATVEPFTVPALGRSTFDLNVSVDVIRALSLLAQNANAETLPYRVTGTVRLTEGVLRTLPFTSNGTVPGPGGGR